MVEREAIGNAAAAVVTGEREMHMAELLHRLDDGVGHRALGVRRVVLVALRHVGPAIARQVGDDQRELVRQKRRDAVPLHMGLRKSVQQQQRRPLAADPGEDAARPCVDPFGGISGKQIGEIGHAVGSPALRRPCFKHCLPLPLTRAGFMPFAKPNQQEQPRKCHVDRFRDSGRSQGDPRESPQMGA